MPASFFVSEQEGWTELEPKSPFPLHMIEAIFV